MKREPEKHPGALDPMIEPIIPDEFVEPPPF